MKHVLVESHADYLEFCESQPTADIRWWTPSVYLLEKMKSEGKPVASIEQFVDIPRLTRIGWTGLAIGKDWVRFFRESPEASRGGVNPGDVLLPQLRLMLVNLLSKAVLIEAWLRHIENNLPGDVISCGHSELSKPAVGFVRFDEKDSLYHTLLKQVRTSVPVQFVEVKHRPMRYPSCTPERASDRWLYKLANLFSADFSKWCYGLWLHGLKGRTISRPGTKPCRDVLFFGNNELIKESYFPLLRGGARISLLEPFADRGQTEEAAQADAWRSSLAGLFDKQIQQAGFGGTAMESARDLAVQRLMDWLPYFYGYVEQGRKHLAKQLTRIQARRPVILSHGLTDPKELVAYRLFQEQRLPVVEVQHGGSAGLTYHHTANVDVVEMNACQASVVYNPNFAAFYERHLGPKLPDVHISGGPSLTRKIGRKWITRPLARKLLGVGADEKVVMYVTNMFHSSALTLPYGHLDTQYFRYQRKLVDEVLKPLDALCFVKVYPSREDQEPNPLTFADLPKHVRIMDRHDFRFLRAGVDMLILDIPFGTLAWALAADVPTVLLDLPFNPLLPEMIPTIENALFRVDASARDWPDQLRNLIGLPGAELTRRWSSMKEQREQFISQCLLGEPGSPGRRIADYTLGYRPSQRVKNQIFESEAARTGEPAIVETR